MNRIILSILNLLEKTVDRWLIWRISPAQGSRTALAILAVVVPGALLIGARNALPGAGDLQLPAISFALPDFPSWFSGNTAVPEPAHLTQYREKFPAGLDLNQGELRYTCSEKLSAPLIARRLYSYSYIYDHRELEEQIKAANQEALKDHVCYNETIILPDPILAPHVNEPLGWPVDTAVHAIYLQGGNSTPRRIQREVSRLKESGANGVVFDVKDIIGVVNYRSGVAKVEEYRKHQAPIADLSKMIKYLHDHDIYIIARMALFQDQNLATRRPDLTIKDGKSPDGKLRTKGTLLWVDPGHQEVQDYNLALVAELVLMGVDEIQFDYVRYPAEGNLKQASYHNVKEPADKVNTIARFLRGAHTLTSLTDTRTSIDIFGVVAWGEEVDINATGQRIERLAPHVDIISPMLYPSHFSKGFDKKARPADEPYHFLHEGVARVLAKAGETAVVRPWLQAFSWRVSNYNAGYIQEQIRGSDAAGGKGWMLWNAGNEYDMAFSAVAPVLKRRQVASR